MRSVLLSCVLYFCIVSKSREELDSFRPKTVRIYKFKASCSGYENTTMTFSDMHMINVNRTFLISSKMVIHSDINHDFKVVAFLSRCSSREALDSCEVYNTITMNHFCKLLNAGNTPWAKFVREYTPPLRCPLKKGVYEVTNTTFDGSAFGLFPVLNWYWKVMFQLRDEVTKELLLCGILEGQVAPI